jgi:hypothetical protein
MSVLSNTAYTVSGTFVNSTPNHPIVFASSPLEEFKPRPLQPGDFYDLTGNVLYLPEDAKTPLLGVPFHAQGRYWNETTEFHPVTMIVTPAF